MFVYELRPDAVAVLVHVLLLRQQQCRSSQLSNRVQLHQRRSDRSRLCVATTRSHPWTHLPVRRCWVAKCLRHPRAGPGVCSACNTSMLLSSFRKTIFYLLYEVPASSYLHGVAVCEPRSKIDYSSLCKAIRKVIEWMICTSLDWWGAQGRCTGTAAPSSCCVFVPEPVLLEAVREVKISRILKLKCPTAVPLYSLSSRRFSPFEKWRRSG